MESYNIKIKFKKGIKENPKKVYYYVSGYRVENGCLHIDDSDKVHIIPLDNIESIKVKNK